MPNNKIFDFIIDNNWNFPHDWQLWFPFLCNLLPSVPDSNSANVYMLTWIHKENGILILKDAYLFKAPPITISSCATEVWCADIPPRKSLLVWKILHGQTSTDNLVMIEVYLWLPDVTSTSLPLNLWIFCLSTRTMHRVYGDDSRVKQTLICKSLLLKIDFPTIGLAYLPRLLCF